MASLTLIGVAKQEHVTSEEGNDQLEDGETRRHSGDDMHQQDSKNEVQFDECESWNPGI